jgi:hypothetical protein
MEQEMKKPFKTVTTEYFEELQETPVGMMERRSSCGDYHKSMGWF